jgi:hypothetical protein
MAITDIITFILSIYLLNQGAGRGFLLSLFGPFSIIIATIVSVMYYQTTQDMAASLIIGLIGPLLLGLLLKLLLNTWVKATNSKIQPDFLSRFGGAILTLMWGWVFIVLILILLSILPPWGPTLGAVHNDVMRSVSYQAARPLEKMLFGPAKQKASPAAAGSPIKDVQSLAQDPRFQKVLQDPEIQKEIQAHDIAKLMQNPKMMDLVQQLMADPETMKKVLAIYRSQTQPQAIGNP